MVIVCGAGLYVYQGLYFGPIPAESESEIGVPERFIENIEIINRSTTNRPDGISPRILTTESNKVVQENSTIDRVRTVRFSIMEPFSGADSNGLLYISILYTLYTVVPNMDAYQVVEPSKMRKKSNCLFCPPVR